MSSIHLPSIVRKQIPSNPPRADTSTASEYELLPVQQPHKSLQASSVDLPPISPSCEQEVVVNKLDSRGLDDESDFRSNLIPLLRPHKEPNDGKSSLFTQERIRVDEVASSSGNGHPPGVTELRVLRFWHRLGLWAIGALVGGFLLVLAAVGFLSFLWFATDNYPDWRRIMLSGFAIRSITLTSVAIRWAVAGQAAVCSSMLAAIALERKEAFLPYVVSFSAMRFIAPGPQSLWYNFLQNFNIRRPRTYLLVSLLALTTSLSQLCSTALLSDIHAEIIHGPPNRTDVPYGSAVYGSQPREITRLGYSGTNVLMQIPPVYPVFAEYSEKPPQYEHDAISDTGLTLRAYLPFPDTQQRQNTQRYSGMGKMVDYRVACAVPSLSEAELFKLAGYRNYRVDLILRGNIWTDFEPPRLPSYSNNTDNQWLANGSANGSVPFECVVPFPMGNDDDNLQFLYNSEANGWHTTICAPPTGSGLVAEMWSMSNYANVSADASDKHTVLATQGDIYIVVNTTGSPKDWDEVLNKTEEDSRLQLSTRGEWLDLYYGDQSYPKVSVTLCFTAFSSIDMTINVNNRKPNIEPASLFKDSTGAIDPELDKRFGPNWQNYPLDERGVLELIKQSSWLAPNPPLTNDDSASMIKWALQNQEGPDTNYTIPLCQGCSCPSAYSRDEVSAVNATTYLCVEPNAHLSWMFQHTMKASDGHPAFAIQALLTTLMGQYLYQQPSANMTVSATAEVVSFVTTSIPTHRRGYVAVMAVLLVHTVLVLIITATFIQRTRATVLNDAWAGTVQLWSEDMRDVMDRAVSLGREDFQGWLKDPDRAKLVMGIAPLPDETRFGILSQEEQAAKKRS